MLVSDYNYSMLPTNSHCKEIKYIDLSNNLTIVDNNENNTKKDYIGGNKICDVINYKYNTSYFHETSVHYYKNSILPINGTLCCLAREGCAYHNKIRSNDDIYCNGAYSCYSINNLFASHNVYCNGRYSCSWSNIVNNNNIISCGGFAGCDNSNIMNSNIVICSSQASCLNSRITNVWTIIATGYVSMCNSTIINATNIYFLGTESGCNANIIVNNNTNNNNNNNNTGIFVDDVKIYCQTNGCANFTINREIYCKDEIKITNNVTSYYNVCSLSSLPTTTYTILPTDYSIINETVTLMDSELEKIIEILNNGSIIIPIVFVVSSLLLISISVKMRLLNKEAIRKHTKMLNSMTATSNDDFETSLIDIYNVDSVESDENNKNSKYVNYIIGFGKSANHIAIIFVFIEIYDVYTDISYLIELIVNKYYLQFEIFLSSIIATIIINIIISLFWLKYEFENNSKFTNWFYEKSGMISFLLILFLLTDLSLIINVFTSQIFGNLLFYSPISMNGIKLLNISLIILMFIEHLPQLIVQIQVIFAYNLSHSSHENDTRLNLTIIQIASLTVGLIDIIFVTVKALIWLILFRTKK